MTRASRQRYVGRRVLRVAALGLVGAAAILVGPREAYASDCLVDTYPADGGVLQGSAIYAFLRYPHAWDSDCDLLGWLPSEDPEEVGLERIYPGNQPWGMKVSLLSGFVLGESYDGAVHVVVGDWSDGDVREYPLSFVAEPIGEVFDPAALILDRVVAMVDEPNRRIVTTIEGRWPGPQAHHFVMFAPHGWSPTLAFPDPDRGGAFKFVYEQGLAARDLRRDFSLKGRLRAVYPGAPTDDPWTELVLLDEVDLRHLRRPTRHCSSGPRGAWPSAGLVALLVRRRRVRRPA